MLARAGLDRLIFAVSIIAVVAAGLWYTSHVEDRLECQARYNEATNERSRVLTEAADRERESERRADDAQAAVFAHPAIFVPVKDRTPQQTRELEALARAWVQAVIDQKQDRADADKARAEHPVPAPPSTVCQ